MKHGLTKEMRAKRKTAPRIMVVAILAVVVFYAVAIGVGILVRPSLWEPGVKAEFGDLLAVALFACLVAILAVIVLTWICGTGYALIWGMPINIDDNYVIGFTPTHYQFSRIYEAQDYFAREHTVRLYLTMDSDELETLYREQWSSVWFEGRAILPIELAIPGRSFSTLYICRSTLKRIRKEVQQSRRSTFVQLVFEFKATEHIGRTSYDRTRLLLSMWDVEKLRAMHQSQPNISFADDSRRYLITWEQLEQYENTLTEAYQIIDPQPITRSDDTV